MGATSDKMLLERTLGSVPLAGGLPRKKHHLSVLRAERCQVEVKTRETERADIEW